MNNASQNPKETYVTYVKPSILAKTKTNAPEAGRDAVFNSAIWAVVSTVLLGNPMNLGEPQNTPNGNIGGLWGQIPKDLEPYQQILIRRTILATILDVNIKAVQTLINTTYNPLIHSPLESLRSKTLVATKNPITNNIALNAVNNILTNIQKNPDVMNKILSDDTLNNNAETLSKINEENCFKNQDFRKLLLTAVSNLDEKSKKSVLEKCKNLKIECKDNDDAEAVFKKYIDQCVEKYTQPFCGGFDEFICNFSELFGPMFIQNVGRASGLSFGFLIFTTLITGYATNQCIMNKKLNANRKDTLLLNTVVDKRPFLDKKRERTDRYRKDVESFFTEKKFLKTLQDIPVNTFFNIILRLAAETPYIFGANAVAYNPNIGAANFPAAIANTVRGCLGGTIFGDIKAEKRGKVLNFIENNLNKIKNSKESSAKDKIYTLLDIDRQCDEKLEEIDNIKKDIKGKLSICSDEKNAIDNPIELLQYVLDTKQYKQTSSLKKEDLEKIINEPQEIKQIIARCDQFNDFLEYAKKQTPNSPINLNDYYAGIYPDFERKANLKLKMPNNIDKEIYHIFKNKQKVIDMAKIYYYAIDTEFDGVENQIKGLKKIIERKKYKYYKQYNVQLNNIELGNSMNTEFIQTFDKHQQNKGFDAILNKKADIKNPRITIPNAAKKFGVLNTDITHKSNTMIQEYKNDMKNYDIYAKDELKNTKLYVNDLKQNFDSIFNNLKNRISANKEKEQIDDYGRYNDDNYDYESYWDKQIMNFFKEKIAKKMIKINSQPFLAGAPLSNMEPDVLFNDKEKIKTMFFEACDNFIKMKQNDADVGQECLKLQDIEKINTNVYQTINEISDITDKFCEASFNKKTKETKLEFEQNHISTDKCFNFSDSWRGNEISYEEYDNILPLSSENHNLTNDPSKLSYDDIKGGLKILNDDWSDDEGPTKTQGETAKLLKSRKMYNITPQIN